MFVQLTRSGCCALSAACKSSWSDRVPTISHRAGAHAVGGVAQVLSHLKNVVLLGVPVAANFAIVIAPLSIVQTVPPPETVISHLSPSDIEPEITISPAPNKVAPLIVFMFVQLTRSGCCALSAACKSSWSESVPVILHHTASDTSVSTPELSSVYSNQSLLKYKLKNPAGGFVGVVVVFRTGILNCFIGQIIDKYYMRVRYQSTITIQSDAISLKKHHLTFAVIP